MSYRITLDPYDPSIARISRRILPALPLYLPGAARSRATPAEALAAAAAQIDADMKARAERRAAAGVR